MIITIEQRGGFIGYLRHDLDTAELSKTDRQEAEQWASRISDEHETLQPISREPEYYITLSEGASAQRVVCSMAAAPEAVRELVKLVREHGTPFLPP